MQDPIRTQARNFRTALAALCIAAILAVPAASLAQTPTADQFAVEAPYKGKTRMPQFKGRDAKYRDFRTRIREGLKQGPDLAGEYSLIQFGCGTGCSMALIASNRTGEVFDFPRGGEANLYMTLHYSRDSRLIVAQWANSDDNSCHIDFFEWKNDKANLLETRKVGVTEDCYKDIGANLK